MRGDLPAFPLDGALHATFATPLRQAGEAASKTGVFVVGARKHQGEGAAIAPSPDRLVVNGFFAVIECGGNLQKTRATIADRGNPSCCYVI